MKRFLSAHSGPERNSRAIACLIVVLAGFMMGDSVLLPLPGPEHEQFNLVAAYVTTALFGCAAAAMLLLLAGLSLLGRFAIVAYGCGLVTAMWAILGRDTGIDIVGAICLLMGPGVIFARAEWRWMILACLISGATVIIMIWCLHDGAAPLLTIQPAFMANIRAGATVVAACVGGLIIYLYWAAEIARAAAAREQARSDELLLNILPRPVADRLKQGERHIADGLADVTILFADIAGFTRFASSRTPAEVVHVLNRIFSRFDTLCIDHGVEKLKTIGDGYMAVAGAPLPMQDHAGAAARMALGMQKAMAEIRAEYPELSLRVGLNSGPAVAGVLGTHKFAYDVWGDAVNLASRLESNAPLNSIAVSASVQAALESRFQFKPMGRLEMKGKGLVPAWELLPQDTR